MAVEIDGRSVAWCDGVFAGDTQMVLNARRAAAIATVVDFHGRELISGSDTPVGAAAAMVARWPGRAFIVECPPEVDDYLEERSPDV